ncbi:MAG: LSU ribosomal protein L19P [Parcubacteria group bacterium Greene0416_79]|nr:MAG: LSU ribosomal protein L19P [Parcubacteria group bacterium Greene0416_79]
MPCGQGVGVYFLVSSVVKCRSMPITISSANIEERRKLTFRAGDTVRVVQKITERVKEKDKVKEKKRLQAFEGLVLARKHGREPGATFTVRRVIDGVGVERIFPLYAPTIEKIEVLKRAKVRRAKLYYIRHKAVKEIRRAMRHERTEKKETPVVEAPAIEIKA